MRARTALSTGDAVCYEFSHASSASVCNREDKDIQEDHTNANVSNVLLLLFMSRSYSYYSCSPPTKLPLLSLRNKSLVSPDAVKINKKPWEAKIYSYDKKRRQTDARVRAEAHSDGALQKKRLR